MNVNGALAACFAGVFAVFSFRRPRKDARWNQRGDPLERATARVTREMYVALRRRDACVAHDLGGRRHVDAEGDRGRGGAVAECVWPELATESGVLGETAHETLERTD